MNSEDKRNKESDFFLNLQNISNQCMILNAS